VGGEVPQAYLCCGVTNNVPKIYCLHMPARFVAALDGMTTEWDDLSFAFLGGIVQGLVSIVQFPDDAFNSLAIPVKTVDCMLQHQDELANQHVFPPVLQDEDDSELIVTRSFMYLPAVYVPLMLNSRDYTEKQVWEILYPAIIQWQEQDICKPLTQWLQVASMGTAQVNPLEVGPPLISLGLNAPLADETLLNHRHSFLQKTLPGLSVPPQALETALTQMATAIVAQTNDNRQAREQKTAEDQEPKLPSKKFEVTLPVLMGYLLINDERNLPQIWHQRSNCSKRQESQVLRDILDALARTPEAYSSAVPIVTAWLVQDMSSFNFVGHSTNDIKCGLHPFVIVDENAKHQQSNIEVARLYGLLTSGDATCSLKDLEALTAKEVRSVPVTYWELESNLGMFGNLIHVVLGSTHPLVTAYREFWTLMRSGLWEDLHAILEYRGYVKPTQCTTHFLRLV
jgi:hypothetical protein